MANGRLIADPSPQISGLADIFKSLFTNVALAAFTVLAIDVLTTFNGLALAGEAVSDGMLISTFRRPIANAYCAVPTFAMPFVPGQARAVLEDGEKPLILIDGAAATTGAYARFLLAHECCHHRRGHLQALKRKIEKQRLANHSKGTRPGSNPHAALSAFSTDLSQKAIELDADCCAANLLAEQADEEALAAAVDAMRAYGTQPTGAAYPSGVDRSTMIGQCAQRR